MAAIADGVAEAEHIHQARVSLRRLRSALKHFSAWSDELNPVWEEQIAELFRQLGDARRRCHSYRNFTYDCAAWFT